MNNIVRRRFTEIDSPFEYDYGINYPIIEPPETVLARSCPSKTFRLLDNESKRRHYNESLSIGANITQNYLSVLESESLSKINQIKIEPEVWGGFGRGHGMVISFKK